MTPEQLQERTKRFALSIIKLSNNIERNVAGKIIASQLVRSGTAVAANYRATCRSRSRADFISKVGVVAEEADESALWLELLSEAKLLDEKTAKPVLKEAEEITRIMAASWKTSREVRSRD